MGSVGGVETGSAGVVSVYDEVLGRLMRIVESAATHEPWDEVALKRHGLVSPPATAATSEPSPVTGGPGHVVFPSNSTEDLVFTIPRRVSSVASASAVPTAVSMGAFRGASVARQHDVVGGGQLVCVEGDGASAFLLTRPSQLVYAERGPDGALLVSASSADHGRSWTHKRIQTMR